jgi:rubrerythrin
MRSTLTRRGALGGAAALALASCGGGDPPPSGQPRAGSGAGLLSSIVALEHAGIAAWAAIAEVLRGDARRYARSIREREIAHAERVADLVRQVGGTPPKTRPADDYARLFPRMQTEADALHFARDLEDRLVRAYLEGLRLLPDSDQRRATVEIAADEAEDLAVVHALAGGPAAPQPFVTGTL